MRANSMPEQSDIPAPAAQDRHYARLTQHISDGDHRRRGPVVYVLAIVLLAGLVLTVWAGYVRGLEARRRAAPIPRITAGEPYKQRAAGVGAGPVDHADKRIFDQVDGYAPATVVDSPPEQADVRLPVESDPELPERPVTADADSDAQGFSRSDLPSSSESSPQIRRKARDTVALVSNWTVQLASMPSRQDAQTAWDRIVNRHNDLFSGLDRAIIRVDLGDRGIFFRLRARGFPDRDAASDFCARYKGRGGDCFVVRS